MVHVACVLSIIIIKSIVLDANGFVNQCFSIIIYKFISSSHVSVSKKKNIVTIPIIVDYQSNNKQSHI